jgi:hypothetical protein
MKSVRLHGRGDLRIHDKPVPVAGEKLIRISLWVYAARICMVC